MCHVEQPRQVGIVAIGKKLAIAGDEVDQALERSLDGGKVFKDVRVIELKIVDDGHLGQVMDELAALVEKGGVIFVAFNDEPLAFGEPRSLSKIGWDAADQVAWVESIMFKDPGQQGSGGGLAVRAGDDQRAFAPDEIFLQQFRKRTIAELAIQHR